MANTLTPNQMKRKVSKLDSVSKCVTLPSVNKYWNVYRSTAGSYIARVTQEQASEIIRRTDMLFLYGQGWSIRQNTIGSKESLLYGERVLDSLGYPLRKPGDNIGRYALVDRWHSLHGIIELEYLINDWIDSSYVHGCHGWCHPDGEIGYCDNIGKYPQEYELLYDWQSVAYMFPFLDLFITLVNREEVPSMNLLNIRVEPGGNVNVVPLDTPNPFGPPDPGRGKRVSQEVLDSWRMNPMGWVKKELTIL